MDTAVFTCPILIGLSLAFNVSNPNITLFFGDLFNQVLFFLQ